MVDPLLGLLVERSWFARHRPSLTPESSGHVRGPVAVERRVEPSRLHELVVRALLDDLSVLEHDDQVGVADRRESVRDDERGAVGEQQPQGRVDLSFGADVDRRGRLVEDQDSRICQERPRERDELSLAEREAGSAFLQLRLVTVLELLDEVVGADGLRRIDDSCERGAGLAEGDVLVDGAGEEEALLRDDSELAPERRPG